MTIPRPSGEPRPPNDPEGPCGGNASVPVDHGGSPAKEAAIPLPHIVFDDGTIDRPGMVAIATRIALMAAVVRASGTIPDGHYARIVRDEDSRLADPPERVHASHVEEAGQPLLLVYDLVGTGVECAPFQLRIELPSATPWHPAVNAEPAVHAIRLDRIVRGMGEAIARGSRTPAIHDGPTFGQVVAEHLQWDFPEALSPFAGIVRTRSFVDGGAEVEYAPRTPSRNERTDILRPDALATLTASAIPKATIVVDTEGPVRRYLAKAVNDVAAIPEPIRDPMERLRRLTAIPNLGEDAYTDVFLTLREALSR